MGFTFSDKLIRNNQIVFIYEECATTGVCTVAGQVREDVGKVFGSRPIGVEYANFKDTADFFSYPVFFGTVGNSAILDALARSSAIDLFAIAGEKEVYMINVVDGLEYEGFRFESALVIAGADDLGTIYGLYRISEMIGIPALSDWMDIMPKRKDKQTLSPISPIVSPAPSAAFRGFAIDDDKKALAGNCKKYIELLLRLRGNTLVCKDETCAAIANEYGIKVKSSCDVALEPSYLPKLSEKEYAYLDREDHGELILNARTVYACEFPLAYFLSVAYDAGRWGCPGEDSAHLFTEEFVKSTFPERTEEECEDICYILLGYTAITEAFPILELGKRTYEELSYSQREALIAQCDAMIDMACGMRDKNSGDGEAFFGLVYIPAVFSLNMVRMWALTGQNHALADAGSTAANYYAKRINDSVKLDRKIIAKLHEVIDGKWKKMELPVPVKNPVVHTVIPSKTPDLMIMIPGSGMCVSVSEAGPEPLILPYPLGGRADACFELSSGSEGKIKYELSADDDRIVLSEQAGKVKCGKIRKVFISLNEMAPDTKGLIGTITVSFERGSANIQVIITDDAADDTQTQEDE